MPKIEIDFENTFEIYDISEDFTRFKFDTITRRSRHCEEGIKFIMQVSIANNSAEFLKEIFNLCFGPEKTDGTIDDKVFVTHADPSKVMSTILLGALTFLNTLDDKTIHIGIDGSNQARAFLYLNIFKENHDYLSNYFKTKGVKYYVRVLRKKDGEQHHMFDYEDITMIPSDMTRDMEIQNDKLFNYFIFNLS